MKNFKKKNIKQELLKMCEKKFAIDVNWKENFINKYNFFAIKKM